MAQSRSSSRRRKESDLGKDETVFFFSRRTLVVETTMRSGDHPDRPVRAEKIKKDERPAPSLFPLPRIWDITAS